MKALSSFATLVMFFFIATSIATSSKVNSYPIPSAGINKLEPRMQSVVMAHVARIEDWLKEPVLLDAVRAQNSQGLTLEQIKVIDQDWLAGRNEDVVARLQTNPAAQFLRAKMALNPQLYVEAFLCDNQGAVVAEYPRTSDYWQGDEDKFTGSFNSPNGETYIGEVELDESTQTFSVQVSLPVIDQGKTIGILIVGLRNIK